MRFSVKRIEPETIEFTARDCLEFFAMESLDFDVLSRYITEQNEEILQSF